MTTTTARPVPHWGFPGAAGGSGGQAPSWSTEGQVSFSQNNATSGSANLTSVDGSGLDGIEAPVGVDPAATPKTIVVKVPKVPHNFGAIQSNKAHLPINIPPKVQAQQPQQPEIISQPRAPAVITSSLEVMDNFTQYCPPGQGQGPLLELDPGRGHRRHAVSLRINRFRQVVLRARQTPGRLGRGQPLSPGMRFHLAQ